jgi:hypothetical protein
MIAQQPLIDDAERDGDGRKDHDFYETPEFQTRALLDRVPAIRNAATILEPCAGRGAIAKLLAANSLVVTNEPYQEHTPSFRSTMQADATAARFWTRMPFEFKFDWVITNPPFNLAHQIIPLAYEHAGIGIAFLLRITWFEPTSNRADWLAAHPPTAIIALPRYKYRKDKEHGDSATTAWFVWVKDPAFAVRNSVVTPAECKRLGA